MEFREFPELHPSHFFSVSIEVPFLKSLSLESVLDCGLLPSFHDLTDSEDSAQAAMAWNKKHVYFAVEVAKSFEQTGYPECHRKDAIEILIDTKNIPDAKSLHGFCHHFVLLPDPDLEDKALEITRFKGIDTHKLADPKQLHVDTAYAPGSYQVGLKIPVDLLHGWDRENQSSIRFTLIVHRCKLKSIYPLSGSCHTKLQQTPYDWAVATLKR